MPSSYNSPWLQRCRSSSVPVINSSGTLLYILNHRMIVLAGTSSSEYSSELPLILAP
ncbi:hypothetical protein CPC16_010115, partial [Podila verticillata]